MLDDAFFLLIGSVGCIGMIWFKLLAGTEGSLQFVYSRNGIDLLTVLGRIELTGRGAPDVQLSIKK
jgi:hypothetical protein